MEHKLKVVILGATGMLGQMISSVLANSGIHVVQVSRFGEVSYDAYHEPFERLVKDLGISSRDYLVNCIGWIPQKATSDSRLNETNARTLNVELPGQIAIAQTIAGFSWIQIGTDCVFDGKGGHYFESSRKEPTDLYGKTKLEGEAYSESSIFVRTSIIGPDRLSNSGLYEWFKSQIPQGTIPGFENHKWNGVTTYAFAKLVKGFILADWRKPIHTHWVPANEVSKHELLRLFAYSNGLSEVEISSENANQSKDRTLRTEFPELNRELWQIAGYSTSPSIEELVFEMVTKEGGDPR